MTSTKYTRFINFLQNELSISSASIAIAERSSITSELPCAQPDSNALLMILWQHGLVTLEQLDKVFDWLQNTYDFN